MTEAVRETRQPPPGRGHSDVTSDGVRVRVGAQFLADQSDPALSRYVYAYRVRIANVGEQPAKLLGRHWVIVDALGEQREVRGPGVVGKQPDLSPGGSFEYVSGCQLTTEWGTMEGSYRMVRPDGSQFEASIGRFFLAPNVDPLPVDVFE